MAVPPEDVTQILAAWAGGNASARDRLVPLVYDELRRLAGGFMRRERPEHSLQPTALVHEAFLRFFQQRKVPVDGREQFFRLIAHLMRRVLVDHARRRGADKRGGGAAAVTLNEQLGGGARDELPIIELHECLSRLEELDPRQAQVVELRVFGGFEVKEVAEILRISPATVKREWAIARAWLHREVYR